MPALLALTPLVLQIGAGLGQLDVPCGGARPGGLQCSPSNGPTVGVAAGWRITPVVAATVRAGAMLSEIADVEDRQTLAAHHAVGGVQLWFRELFYGSLGAGVMTYARRSHTIGPALDVRIGIAAPGDRSHALDLSLAVTTGWVRGDDDEGTASAIALLVGYAYR